MGSLDVRLTAVAKAMAVRRSFMRRRKPDATPVAQRYSSGRTPIGDRSFQSIGEDMSEGRPARATHTLFGVSRA